MNICEYLGLKPNREFKVEGKEFRYRFNEKDEFEYYSYTIDDWTLCNNTMVLSKILHDSSLIEAVESKVNIGLSYHDIVILNGLVRRHKSKIVMIERDIKYKNDYDEHGDEEINFFFENDRRLGLSCCNVKLDFLEDFDCSVFEVKCGEGYIKVWGIR